MKPEMRANVSARAAETGGLTGWLLGHMFNRFRHSGQKPPRLAVVERIALAPRQSLALVEAEGRRLLVATSADGVPVFYPLDAPRPPRSVPAPGSASRRADAARVS